MSYVVQCQRCRLVYGYHPDLPELQAIPDGARYADCNIWNCPGCQCLQDTRDIQPFMGCTGGGNLKLLSEDEVLELVYQKTRKIPEGYERVVERVGPLFDPCYIGAFRTRFRPKRPDTVGSGSVSSEHGRE